VSAHWDVLGDIVKKVHEQYSRSANRPLLIGNGDVKDIADARRKVREYGVDGVMLGRAIFGNPFLFAQNHVILNTVRNHADSNDTEIPREDRDGKAIEKRLSVMLEHTLLFEQLFAGIKNFDIMKKHYKAYVSGFDGAKELRVQLMASKTAQDVAAIIHKSFPSV
jgi:tRNA-dihydrouridine synthase